MQRYHAASCTSAVNNTAIGGSARDVSRAESSSIPSNFSLNSRRPLPLTPYKLRCDKEPLNSRLGLPDFHLQTPTCPEETLTRDYVQSGYRETVEGIEENRETSLSQIQTFTKPVILKCKESIRKCHRAINESRAQKRKAGQVYGVPLSGSLLSKPGPFPEQKPCGEEFRKKWIEGLSQPHKRLCSLADHVPHGYRRKSLLEVLIRNNVPLLRATWFVKVTYLNQVRPGSSNLSGGVPDKTQFSRSEQWTKDIIDYLQALLDEFVSKNNFHSTLHIRDRSPQMVYPGTLQHRNDAASTSTDADEPSLHFKWWYVVRLLQWHHAEGLIVPSLIIDWVFNQLQEKERLGILQLLLPVIYGVIEAVVLCQTYVRTLVGIAMRFIQEPSPGGSDLVDNSRRAYTMSALVEMLHYLIIAVPDTFVALDCFPLPLCLVTNVVNDGSFLLKIAEDESNMKTGPLEVACLQRDKGVEVHPDSLTINCIVSSIQKRAENLAKAARPGHPSQNVAKALLALDKSLIHGDVSVAYKLLFENLCDGAVDERWIAEVSLCLRSSLKYIGAVTLSFISSIFFICEWATCDFRDFRTGPPSGQKFTGRKDLSQIYIAIRILQLKRREMQSLSQGKNESSLAPDTLAKDPDLQNNYPGRFPVGNACEQNKYSLKSGKTRHLSNIFESPSPLHDIIVCWIDQHEVHSGEGVKRLQLLIMELVRAGIFYPQAYVRQLIVSGIMDGNGISVDLERRKRHHRILKQLPSSYVHDALEEAQVLEGAMLLEVINTYANERRLVLRGLLDCHKSSGSSWQKQKHYYNSGGGSASPSSVDQWRSLQGISSLTTKNVDQVVELEDLKASIVMLLQLPSSSLSSDSGLENFVGGFKRSTGSSITKIDIGEGTPGCEECRRVKRQKLSEDRSSYPQGFLSNALDDEDIWWLRRGPKSLDKMDPPPKQAKQSGRGRQKGVRKTQSLAQLAAARIEGSQGASTSHVCDNRVNCPHHRTGVEGDAPKSGDGIRMAYGSDIVSIGKVLKKMRLVEKRTVMLWLISVVKHLVEEAEKTAAKVGQYGRPYSAVDDANSVRWKLGEDELSMILYLMDVSNELVSAARFLLWLLPKALSSPAASIHAGRNILMLPRNTENVVCEVGEAFLVSSIRRYENIIVAADLVPETLKAAMHRVAATMASTGRVSGSSALVYARNLVKKYGNVASVVDWEKNLKSSYDKRLISELESGRLPDAEFGFPLGVPAGVEDLDDFFRHKISGVRVSRVALTMRDIVQRQVDEVFQYFCGKERKLFGPGTVKSPVLENLDDGYQIAQQIVMGLMECMRQTGGAAQEGDPTLVSSAISAIVSNVGLVIAKIPDLTAGNHLNFQSTSSSMHFARRILRIHTTCLCLLKDALGERQSRVFEVALAVEASTALAQVFVPGKAPRTQFHPSPESHDSSSNSYETLNSSVKSVLGRGAKIAGAISALLVGALLQGVTSLERMVTLFRLREGLDPIHFFRSLKSNSNGSARSIGAPKLDNLVEVSTHWFRVLVGNCRTVSDGFIVELLGEASVVGLSRMQRALPLNLVFPPAYSIFAFVIWKGLIFNTGVGLRDDLQQLYQSLALAIGDALKHLPFRDVCLRDTHGLYDLIAADAIDSEFAALLESHSADVLYKSMAFVPLRARLFLNALIDCRMPQSLLKPEDGNRMQGQGGLKNYYQEKDANFRDKLVHVLDTLQPAKFHWQWVELRLLLNEQTVIDKLKNEAPLAEAIKSVSPNADKVAVSEKESSFVELVVMRLLARPDAASLFSEVVHLFGRSLEDQMLMQTKWLLGGTDVLYGRKSIRQRLIINAEKEHLSTKLQFWKPWGWCDSNSDSRKTRGSKRKFEVASLEEGEVVDEGSDVRFPGRGSTQVVDVEGFLVSQQHVTERAFIELVLPCVDQGSDASRNTFANDMIKQMNNIEQQINVLSHGAAKSVGSVASGAESPASKGNSRKGMRGGSPGLSNSRRPAGPADGVPSSPAGLRASMSLRLQFLLRLLPTMCTDGEPGKSMRQMLAAVILRLLGCRVVHEAAGHTTSSTLNLSKRDVESLTEASATSVLLSGESLFDCLLLLLHGLLSSYRPSWLKLKSNSKSASECGKDFSVFGREVAENLQNDLNRMHMPDHIRWRIQTAMPILLPSVRCSISCQPPSISPASIAALQSSNQISVLQPHNSILSQRNPVSLVRTVANMAGKAKQLPLQDLDLEIDPWTLLEDGTGVQSSSNSAAIGGSDHANLRASNWLKGAIRVRRTDLTYIGAIDEDS
ncbi:mediator of RNA polymerase II transcription subunit 12 [Coffea eugenioides]|uniref:mediator of RNA polymerase II transcription subunit 12 n=1 Tax=Coffea eugenioides TaxID=49369 RepID=UPI000F609ABB|nr:mediator of RNA polymerase II transcription subunit 12 [Coffea eugenioides]